MTHVPSIGKLNEIIRHYREGGGGGRGRFFLLTFYMRRLQDKQCRHWGEIWFYLSQGGEEFTYKQWVPQHKVEMAGRGGRSG